jgi:hypothetical protein
VSADISKYLALVTSEHQKPNFLAVIAALVQGQADNQAILAGLVDDFDLDLAVGVQLDAVGVRVGISRNLTVPLTGVFFSWGVAGLGWGQGSWVPEGSSSTTQLTVLDDASYRVLLKFKIAANNWDGTIPGAYAIFANLNAFAGAEVLIQDIGGMEMIFALLGTVDSAVIKALFAAGELLLKPAAVRATLMEQTDTTKPYFGWGVENATISGWGVGTWGKVDGVD